MLLSGAGAGLRRFPLTLAGVPGLSSPQRRGG
jgi:hypothetical protein